MRTFDAKIGSEFHHKRLDIFLTECWEDAPSRTFIQRLIEEGSVLVNGSPAKSHHKVRAGDEIHAVLEEEGLRGILPQDIPLDIFFEDDHLIVVNKPSGMLTHPAQRFVAGTLVNALLYHCRKLSDVHQPDRPGIVHRLDKETSGLLVVAKDNRTHVRLSRQFEKHKVKKQYLAFVEGEVEFDEGMIEAPLGRHPVHREKRAVHFDETKVSVTFYRVVKRFKEKSLVRLYPLTGRTHQLRVHMAHLGHPVLGDEKYGRKETFPRLALHAQALGFVHPETKLYMECVTKTPSEFLPEGFLKD